MRYKLADKSTLEILASSSSSHDLCNNILSYAYNKHPHTPHTESVTHRDQLLEMGFCDGTSKHVKSLKSSFRKFDLKTILSQQYSGKIKP